MKTYYVFRYNIHCVNMLEDGRMSSCEEFINKVTRFDSVSMALVELAKWNTVRGKRYLSALPNIGKRFTLMRIEEATPTTSLRLLKDWKGCEIGEIVKFGIFTHMDRAYSIGPNEWSELGTNTAIYDTLIEATNAMCDMKYLHALVVKRIAIKTEAATFVEIEVE